MATCVPGAVLGSEGGYWASWLPSESSRPGSVVLITLGALCVLIPPGDNPEVCFLSFFFNMNPKADAGNSDGLSLAADKLVLSKVPKGHLWLERAQSPPRGPCWGTPCIWTQQF